MLKIFISVIFLPNNNIEKIQQKYCGSVVCIRNYMGLRNRACGSDPIIIGIGPLVCVWVGPAALGPCHPGDANLCLVQPGPKPRALFLKQKHLYM